MIRCAGCGRYPVVALGPPEKEAAAAIRAGWVHFDEMWRCPRCRSPLP